MRIKVYRYGEEEHNTSRAFDIDDKSDIDIRVNDRLVWTSRKLTYKEVIDVLIGNFEVYGVQMEQHNEEFKFVWKDKEISILIGPPDKIPPMGTMSYYNVVFNSIVDKLQIPIK